MEYIAWKIKEKLVYKQRSKPLDFSEINYKNIEMEVVLHNKNYIKTCGKVSSPW